MYDGILGVLVDRGRLKTTHMMHWVNVNSKDLKEYVKSLIAQCLVEERIVEKGRIVMRLIARCGSTQRTQ
jgi:predicted transcriptional regulator